MLGPERKTQLIGYFIGKGHGGALLLLWSIGVGLFFIFGLPIFALVWTGVVVSLSLGMIRAYRSSPGVYEQLLKSYLAERFPWHVLLEPSLQKTVQQSANVFVEVALKLHSLGTAGDERAELDRVLAAGSGLLSSQFELAQRADDLARGLNLVLPVSQKGADLTTEAPAARSETVDALNKEASQARGLADDIGQQLETLMLRVFQLEQLPNAVHGVKELAGEIETALARAQEKVESLCQATPSLADRPGDSELAKLKESLQKGFSKYKSTQGLKALQQLAYEYAQLQSTLERRKEDQSLLAARIPTLAEESYRQGLGVLELGLELVQAINSPNGERLEREKIRIESEIECIKRDATQARRVKLLKETLASHKERLSLLDQQAIHVEELLHQAGRCEASLNQARIQLLSLSADGYRDGVSSVNETLTRIIQQAKEVQEELKDLGF